MFGCILLKKHGTLYIVYCNLSLYIYIHIIHAMIYIYMYVCMYMHNCIHIGGELRHFHGPLPELFGSPGGSDARCAKGEAQEGHCALAQ